jgi:hypothetical protein
MIFWWIIRSLINCMIRWRWWRHIIWTWRIKWWHWLSIIWWRMHL